LIEGSPVRRLFAVTPAKVNLGLEVLQRRADGYHELVSVLQAISLFDSFVWSETGTPFEYSGPEAVDRERDLIWRVLATATDFDQWTGHLRVVKRIPIAAGLGGGSSDAALALRLAFPDADDDELAQRAAAHGSDVPFFVRGGTALATGRGTDLTPIATPDRWLVLVTPPVDIPEKTRALYSGLEPADFSDGANVRDITGRLGGGQGLPGQLPNVFARQLLGQPVIRYAYDRLRGAGASLVSVSGAGPTLYAVTASQREATRIAAALGEADPPVGVVQVVRTLAGRGEWAAIRAMAAALRGS
jgi:4-diphosphocytidyl-2-C-methyl-D-erythritol kinase